MQNVTGPALQSGNVEQASEAISGLPPKTRAAIYRLAHRAHLRLKAGLELPRFLDPRLRQLADDVADYREGR
jgi:hypothetical protein